MPVFVLIPKNKDVERTVYGRMAELNQRVKERVSKIPGFPLHDILVSLLTCPYSWPDPDLADVALYGDTCPSEVLEPESDSICDDIAVILADMGFTDTKVYPHGSELWLRFFNGSWRQVKDRVVVDFVNHPRRAKGKRRLVVTKITLPRLTA